MALYTQLASGTITTASVAVATVPAGEVWAIYSVTLSQPAAGLAKEIAFTINAAATLANAQFGASFIAGVQRQVLYPGEGVPAGQTINTICSADTGVCTFSINGFKQKTV